MRRATFSPARRELCAKGPLINTEIIGYNYDMAEGVDYEIDLTQPEGQRIRNLTWKGKPLRSRIRSCESRSTTTAAGGAAGYSMFRNAKIVWRSQEDIRQLMIDYFGEQGELPAKPDGNWRIMPPEALQTLEREALKEAPVNR